MAAEINWKNLRQAITYFEAKGFKYVEVPWAVSDEITKATCPEDRWIIHSEIGNLVGSAEQSFLQLDLQGALGKGRFVGCSPCFRNEDTVDELHQKTFMKVELYINDRDNLEAFVLDMMRFYKSILINHAHDLKIIEMRDGSFDIFLNDIEIGSYGRRTFQGISWMYGTALAEPRFTFARNYEPIKQA